MYVQLSFEELNIKIQFLCSRSECHRCVSKTHPRKKDPDDVAKKCVSKNGMPTRQRIRKGMGKPNQTFILCHTHPPQKRIDSLMLSFQPHNTYGFDHHSSIHIRCDHYCQIDCFSMLTIPAEAETKHGRENMEIYVVHSYFPFQRTRP